MSTVDIATMRSGRYSGLRLFGFSQANINSNKPYSNTKKVKEAGVIQNIVRDETLSFSTEGPLHRRDRRLSEVQGTYKVPRELSFV